MRRLALRASPALAPAARAQQQPLERGQKLADQESRRPGAERLPAGIVVVLERRGDGPRPAATDRVRVKYEGRLVDGSRFDGNDSAEFRLDQVIPCWTQGVQRMQVG